MDAPRPADTAGQSRPALIAMPWPLYNRPSIQIGALSAYLRAQDEGIEPVPLHPYLEVARLLGPATYHRISQNLWLCEALYAPLLFPEKHESAGRLAGKLMGRRPFLDFDRTVASLGDHLAGWVSRQPWHTFGLAGFSVCFHQLFASLAAAREIKRACPELPVVFGGSSCAGAAGESLARVFPCIDHIISGEGEQPLLALCRQLAGRSAPAPEVPQLRDLSDLPVPDYAAYFAEMAANFGPGLPFLPEIPVEFSRGCWWNRCTFCNLNLQWCGYRAKKAEAMATEVRTLAGQHDVADFTFTDNVLPPKEAPRFFALLRQEGHDLRFFAEIRANLGESELATMRQGGLTVVQAGIEALSDSLLRRMEKGATVMENLALMKASLSQGIRLEGNLITEFPGATAAEVEETLAVLDFLWPFPPLTTAAFFLGHGSPVAEQPRGYGITEVKNHPHYRQLIPLPILSQLTLLIGDYQGNRAQARKLWAPVVRKVAAWQRFHAKRGESAVTRPLLALRDGGTFLLIRQETPAGQVLHHRLKGTSRAIYLACGQVIDRKTLLERFPRVTENNLIAFLDDLVAKRMLFRHGEHVLALAVRERKEETR
ncbi:MAG: RiPP maturation radical SAM C-methyltransferase [Thermodesulfobacteriota bacterium]